MAPRKSHAGLWVLLVAIAVVAAVAIVGNARSQQAADDERSDVYYCTLSGVGPYDHGPKTGRLCADLLGP